MVLFSILGLCLGLLVRHGFLLATRRAPYTNDFLRRLGLIRSLGLCILLRLFLSLTQSIAHLLGVNAIILVNIPIRVRIVVGIGFLASPAASAVVFIHSV